MTESPEPSMPRGRLLVAAAALMWSLGGVVTKGLAPLDGVTIAFYRSLFAGLALLPFVPRGRWRFRPAMVPVMVIFGIMVGFYLSSVTLTTAANAILLQYSATFWTVPLGYLFLRERPDRRSLAAIAVATVGIAAIVAYGRNGMRGEGFGIALGLASGIGYASVIVAFRAFRGVDPGWLSAANNLGGAATLGVYALAAFGGLARPSAGQWPVLIGFGIIQMAIPYLLFAKGLQHVRAAEAGLITLLEPVLSPLWVFLAHGERPARFTAIGGAVLLLGVAIRYLPTGPAENTFTPDVMD